MRNNRSARIILATIAAASMVGVAACSSNPAPADPAASDAGSSGDWDSIVEEAAGGGRLTVYSVASPVMNDSLLAAFNEAYPDIEVDIVRGGSELLARVDQEVQSNSPGADVFLMSSPQWFLNNEDRLVDLADLPASEGYPRWGVEDYAPSVALNPLGAFVWNTDEFPDGFDSYDDVIVPEAKGRFGFFDGVPEAMPAGYLQFLADQNGEDYIEELAELEPRFYPSVIPTTQAVASGELGVIILTSPATVIELQDQGAPIDYFIPEDVWAANYVAGLLDKAANPAAGQVFMDFLMSVDGQTALNGNGGTASPLPDIEGALNLDDSNVVTLDPEQATNEWVDEWAQRYQEVFRR